MLTVKPLQPGEPLSREIDARVLCSETVSVSVGRSGYSLTYYPGAASRWRVFDMTEDARLVLEGMIPGGLILGAFADGIPVGLAVAAARQNLWCDVLDLRVDVACRLQGVGRALLEAVRRYASQAGMAGLRMTVSDANPVMCQFAQHCGFTLEGIDRLLWAMTPEERLKPAMRRACALIFYRRENV